MRDTRGKNEVPATAAAQAENQAVNQAADLKARLEDFMATYLGAKVQDGITYVLLTDDRSNSEQAAELMDLYNELRKAGKENLFRYYSVSNGKIFDIDLNVARNLTAALAKKVMNINSDLIGKGPAVRRQGDIERLAKSCRKWYSKGIDTVEVALFSRNSVPRINISGKDAAGRAKMLTYEAYAIRHWDLDAVNALLREYGIRILAVDTHEILPSETGLRVTLRIGLV